MEEMGLSKTELLSTDDDDDFVGEVIDEIWGMPWPEDSESKEYIEYFKSLPEEKRVIWSTWRVQSEVENGGFGGYFANLEDDYFVAEALAGFRTLGAESMHAMFESVLNYFNEKKDQIHDADGWDEYAKFMGHAALAENLDNINFRFLDEIDDFYVLRKKYITDNIDVFCDRQ